MELFLSFSNVLWIHNFHDSHSYLFYPQRGCRSLEKKEHLHVIEEGGKQEKIVVTVGKKSKEEEREYVADSRLHTNGG